MRRPLSTALLATCALVFAGAERASAADVALGWSPTSSSPRPALPDALTDRQAELLARCGTADSALIRVASRIVERKLAGDSYLDEESLSFAQRVEGEPHVWPRAWVVSGRAMDHASALAHLGTWRASFRDLGERRCGVASGFAPDGTEVIAAIALDALADLEPLPLRARIGQWIDVRARLLTPATSARVLVQGPSGEPRRIPTALERGRIAARFAPESPGEFTVQIVAEVGTGPRPILEARVFADVEPPKTMPTAAAPGEDARDPSPDPAHRLAAMVDALRDSQGLSRPQRDAALDGIALAHARAMLQVRAVGHDVGDGEPTRRLQNAGISAREVGENVAHAATVALAHRALWQSPSHRANLLRGDFTRAGYAAVEDTDGSAWVCEVFAK